MANGAGTTQAHLQCLNAVHGSGSCTQRHESLLRTVHKHRFAQQLREAHKRQDLKRRDQLALACNAALKCLRQTSTNCNPMHGDTDISVCSHAFFFQQLHKVDLSVARISMHVLLMCRHSPHFIVPALHSPTCSKWT